MRYMMAAGTRWLGAAIALIQLCAPVCAQEPLQGRAETATPDQHAIGTNP